MDDTDDILSPEFYLSEEEIVTDMLLYKMSEKEKQDMRQLLNDELPSLHNEVGLTLKSFYRLMEGDNPYTIADTNHPDHPEHMAFRILCKVWSRLTGKTYTPPKQEILDLGDGTYILNGSLVYSCLVGC